MQKISRKKLPKSFYLRDTLTVAKELIGKLFVKNENGILYSGIIVECEAYDGNIDRASHSYGGMTKRTEVMFREGGYLYVYFTYGMHFCANVVAGNSGHGTGILIRAVEPVDGIIQMGLNRFGNENLTGKEIKNLTGGPAKLCKAFGIQRQYNGTDLTGNLIYLTEGITVNDAEIGTSKRIGITKSVDLPWRFIFKNNPYLSRKK